MPKIGSLFIWLDDDNVANWLVARASGQRKQVEKKRRDYAKKQIVNFVKKDLQDLGFKNITLHWNSKSGCSCGCSPGFDIRTSGHIKDKHFIDDINRWRRGNRRENWSIDYYFSNNQLKRDIGNSISHSLSLPPGRFTFPSIDRLIYKMWNTEIK